MDNITGGLLVGKVALGMHLQCQAALKIAVAKHACLTQKFIMHQHDLLKAHKEQSVQYRQLKPV